MSGYDHHTAIITRRVQGKVIIPIKSNTNERSIRDLRRALCRLALRACGTIGWGSLVFIERHNSGVEVLGSLVDSTSSAYLGLGLQYRMFD